MNTGFTKILEIETHTESYHNWGYDRILIFNFHFSSSILYYTKIFNLMDLQIPQYVL
jgi:hypothetical protein